MTATWRSMRYQRWPIKKVTWLMQTGQKRRDVIITLALIVSVVHLVALLLVLSKCLNLFSIVWPFLFASPLAFPLELIGVVFHVRRCRQATLGTAVGIFLILGSYFAYSKYFGLIWHISCYMKYLMPVAIFPLLPSLLVQLPCFRAHRRAILCGITLALGIIITGMCGVVAFAVSQLHGLGG